MGSHIDLRDDKAENQIDHQDDEQIRPHRLPKQVFIDRAEKKQSTKQTEQGARCPGRNMLVKGKTGDAAANSGKKINDRKSQRTENSFHHNAYIIQGNHVHDQMDETDMQEHGRDDTPPFAVDDCGVVFSAKHDERFRVRASAKPFQQEKHDDVDV